MEPTARRQSLREQLGQARDALDRGDPAEALAAVDRALALDPDYLAAQALKERILRQPAAAPSSTAPRAELTPLPPASRSGATAMASGLLRVEARSRARRIEKRAEAARAALARGRTQEARAAIDEIAAIAPEHPEYRLLLTELQAHTSSPERRRTQLGPAVAAVAVFAAFTLLARYADSPRDRAPAAAVQPAPVAGRLDVPPPARTDTAPAPVAVANARTDGPIPAATSPLPAPAPDVRASLPGRTPAPLARASAIEQARLPAPVPAERPPAEPLRSQPRVPAIAPIAPSDPSQLPGALTDAPQDARVRPADRARDVMAVSRPTDSTPVPTTLAVRDEDLVRRALQQYRQAYDTLDARAAQAVWPGVDSAALQRAFDGLASQRLTFQSCQLRVDGSSASAVCRGSAQYTPRVGSREARQEPRNWRFALRKTADNAWQIESARVGR